MTHLVGQRLPYDVETGAVYGPSFATEITTLNSGREKRNRLRDALRVGDLSFAPRLAEDYPELLAFFLRCNGRMHSFDMRDFSDYFADWGEGVCTAVIGDSAKFQLAKVYTIGSSTVVRPIQRPLAGFAVTEDGSPLTEGSDYTVDSLGVITVGSAPSASSLAWAGEFDNAVRFDTDRMATSIAAADVFAWGSIPVREVWLTAGDIA